VDPQYLDQDQGDRGQYNLEEESFQVYVPLAQLYPEVFRGGISLFGCDSMDKLPIPFKPGASHYHRVEMNGLDQSLRFLDGGARPQGAGGSTVD